MAEIQCAACHALNPMGQKFCGQCGQPLSQVVGSPPATSAVAGVLDHPGDEAIAGAATAALSRGAVGEVSGYLMSRDARDRLAESGESDSAAYDIAQTGLNIARIKIIAGIIFGIIFLIVFLIVLSHILSASNNINGNLPDWGLMARVTAHGARAVAGSLMGLPRTLARA